MVIFDNWFKLIDSSQVLLKKPLSSNAHCSLSLHVYMASLLVDVCPVHGIGKILLEFNPATTGRHYCPQRGSVRPWSTMQCSQPAAWITIRSLLVASCAMASGRPTNSG